MAKNKLLFLLAFVFAAGMLMAACGSGGGSSELGNIEIEAPADEEKTEEAVSGTEESGNEESANEAEEGSSDMSGSGKTEIEIIMKDMGTIVVELDSEAAPITVANFLKLVDEGFYDGLIFHRIIQDFMIQGGDPDGTGMGGPKEKIKGEFASNGWDNPISHVRGVISMARSQDPDSAGSQFFITTTDKFYLDGEYAAFGVVTSGMDVVYEVAAVETGANDRPVDPPVIESIRRK